MPEAIAKSLTALPDAFIAVVLDDTPEVLVLILEVLVVIDDAFACILAPLPTGKEAAVEVSCALFPEAIARSLTALPEALMDVVLLFIDDVFACIFAPLPTGSEAATAVS